MTNRVNVTFIADRDQLLNMSDAAEDVQHLLGQAADVFRLLYDGVSNGSLDPNDPGILSIYELGARAFCDAANKEGAAVAGLGAIARFALKEAVR